MFSRSAHLYDIVYGSLRERYAEDAAALHDIIQQRVPGASTLLDVGCGTGIHLHHFSSHYRVAGVDLEPGMVAIARQRNPGVPIHQADALTMDLKERFDAITFLFSGIGYVGTLANLHIALGNLVRHLMPAGVLIVDGWIRPEAFHAPHIRVLTAEAEGTIVARMSHSTRVENLSILDMQYLVGTKEGIEYFSERHELGLFPREQFVAALSEAGLPEVTVQEKSLGYASSTDRDRYIAWRTGTPE